MGADCKSAGYAYAGSNPARPKEKKFFSYEPIIVHKKFNFKKLKINLQHLPFLHKELIEMM